MEVTVPSACDLPVKMEDSSIKFNPVIMHDALQSLGNAKLSVLDLGSGYWQIPIAKSSRKYVAHNLPGWGISYNVTRNDTIFKTVHGSSKAFL